MILTGDGVVLRPWRATDAPDLMEACGEPEIADWSSFPFHPERSKVAAWVLKQDTAAGVSLAVTTAGDVARGYCALGPADGDRVYMAYWLVPSARGAGLATCAARTLLEWARDSGYATEITLMIKPGNAPSRAVAARLGARLRPGVELWNDRQGRRHALLRYAWT